VTVQVEDVEEHDAPVQTYDVTDGLQLALKVEVDPAVTDPGVALKVQLGTGVLTVTMALAALPAPAELTPATE
jgi:hypothetical protein